MQYKKLLKEDLHTFSVSFSPLDEHRFINKYLKTRLNLLLNEKKFQEVFGTSNDDQVHKDTKIWNYIESFMEKMHSVFKNSPRFIGTPLQLKLQLKNSIVPFKEWVERGNSKTPNFDYLGNDILEVYDKFINQKYDIYFKKVGIIDQSIKKDLKKTFNKRSEILAKVLLSIPQSKDKKYLKSTKRLDGVLSTGVIKSEGRKTLAFIHPTFREYFAAKVCIGWIKKKSVFPNKIEQAYLLKNILVENKYEVIQAFINIWLGGRLENEENPVPLEIAYIGYCSLNVLGMVSVVGKGETEHACKPLL